MMGSKRLVRSKRGHVQSGRGPAFGVALRPGESDPGRASMEQYWHPQRDGVEQPPADYAARLHRMHPDVYCCRPPASAPLTEGDAAWTFWYKRERIQHPLSPGWMMLFAWRNDAGVPEPLDERCFAVLYSTSALKWGDGAQYFERAIVQKQADAKASRQRAYDNHRKSKQRELIQSHRISSAGHGSKSALHHDGTVAPSRGQLNWYAERRRQLLPPELIQAEDDAAEQHRAQMAYLSKLK